MCSFFKLHMLCCKMINEMQSSCVGGVPISEEEVRDVDVEEIKHVMSDEQIARCSFPLDIISKQCHGKQKKEGEEKLPILASKSCRHWKDDDPVDLTEPRLESFCQ